MSGVLRNRELVCEKSHDLSDELVNSHNRLVCAKEIEPICHVCLLYILVSS